MVPVQENLRAEPNRHSMNAIPPTPDSSWLNPSVEQQGLARYVSTLRERKWLIALTVLVTTLAAVGYVLTASKLVTSTTVAKRVKARLHDSRSAEKLLEKVSVAPVATSNIVAVTADGGSPKEAQQLANAFAQEAVANRTEDFHSQIDKRIANIKPQVKGTPS